MNKDKAIEIIKLHRDAMHCLMPNDDYCLSDLNLGGCEDCTSAFELAVEALSKPEIIYCKDCKHARVSKDYFDFDDTPLCECNYMTQPNRWHEFCSWAERK